MARQTFEKGQTVYVTRWSRTAWREAVVTQPDIEDTSYRFDNRKVHYVGIRYIKDKEGPFGDTWKVLNNRQQIVTKERYAEIEQAEDVGKLRQTIDTHRAFERDFTAYVTMAEVILNQFSKQIGPGTINKLALLLRGKFRFQSEWSRLTAKEVAKERADRRTEAETAHAALVSMGETPPELP